MDTPLQHGQDRGALWRFEKDGRHGYLYGMLGYDRYDGRRPLRDGLLRLDAAAVCASHSHELGRSTTTAHALCCRTAPVASKNGDK